MSTAHTVMSRSLLEGPTSMLSQEQGININPEVARDEFEVRVTQEYARRITLEGRHRVFVSEAPE